MANKFVNGGVLVNATDVTIPVLLRKAADNTEQTAIAWNTGGNLASYQRQGAARVAITLATQTVTGAHADGGFVEIDATNQKGLYRFDVPDLAFASGADFVVVSFFATNGYWFHVQIPLGLPAGAVASGVAQSASSTGLVLAASEDWANDEPNGMTIVIRAALAGARQARIINDYVGSTDTVTVDAWTTTPTSNATNPIVYDVYATPPGSLTVRPQVDVQSVIGQQLEENGSGNHRIGWA